MAMEKPRTPKEKLGGNPGGLDPLDQSDAYVTVSHGPYTESVPIKADSTVKEIRKRYRDRFDIDPQSEAIVDGNVVGDDTKLGPGQMLLFSRKAGEKGN